MARHVAAAVAAALILAPSATAQTWTGAANGSWSNGSNWFPTGVPVGGSDTALTFGAANSSAMTDDIGVVFQLNQMTFSAGGPAYTLGGNPLNFVNSAASTSPQINFNTSGGVTIGDNVTLTGNLSVVGTGSGTLTLNGSLGGSGGLTVSGAGAVALGNGSNSYTGNTVVSSGTLLLTAGTAIPTGGNVLVGGGQFNIGALSNASATAIGMLTVNGGGTFRVPGGNGNYFLNQLAMTGGTVDFTGTNDFWLHFVNANAGITINSSATTATWVGAGNSRIQNDTSGPLTITVNSNGAAGIGLDAGIALSGNGMNPNYLITGSGTMRLASPANTGNITVDNFSRLRVDDMASNGGVGALGTGTLTLSNFSTLQYGGPTSTSAKPITISGPGFSYVQVLTNGASLALGGTVSESMAGSGLVILGPATSGSSATVTLAVNNAYTGSTAVDGNGVLAIATIANGGAPSPIGSSSNNPANLVIGAYGGLGTLMLTGTNPTYSTDRGITIVSNSSEVANADNGSNIGVQNAGTNLTVSGQITAPGAAGGFLTKVGAGTLTLTNTGNSFGTAANPAVITIQAGTLNVGAAGAVIPVGTDVTVSAGAAFQVGFTSGSNGSAPIGTLTLDGGTFRVPGGSPIYYLHQLATTTAGGTIDLTGSTAAIGFADSGATAIISGNTLWAGSGASISGYNTTLPVDINIAPNVTLTSHVPLNYTFHIVGGGTLYMATLPYASANSLMVSQGRLRVDDLSVTNNSSVVGFVGFGVVPVTLDGGTLQYSGTTQLSPMPISLSTAGGTVEVSNAATTLTLTGLIAGSGSVVGPLVKTGPGVLTLANTANTYVGGIVVNAGRLDVAADAQLGAANPTVNAGGTLRYTASDMTARTFNLAGGTLEAASGVTLTLNGAAVNGGFLHGPGTFIVTGGTSLTGGTTYASTPVNIAAASFTNFSNGGPVTVAAGVTGVAFSHFTNQGSGSISVGAGSQLNAADFQTYGTMTLNPGPSAAQATRLTNTGTSPVYFNGGSRSFIGTPQTAGQNLALVDLHGQNAIVAGGLFVNNGFVGDSTSSGATIIADFGSLVKGAGTFANGVITQNGGKFQAGNSPGKAVFGQLTLGPGGLQNYLWQINNAMGLAGPPPDENNQFSGWGLLSSETLTDVNSPHLTSGDLTWTATGTAFGRLNMSLQTLINPVTFNQDIPGLMANFDQATPYVWKFVQWQGIYNGPTTDTGLTATVNLDTTNFLNPFQGMFSLHYNGTAKEIDLVYTPVPEPGPFILLAVAGLPLLRRRKTKPPAAEAGLAARIAITLDRRRAEPAGPPLLAPK